MFTLDHIEVIISLFLCVGYLIGGRNNISLNKRPFDFEIAFLRLIITWVDMLIFIDGKILGDHRTHTIGYCFFLCVSEEGLFIHFVSVLTFLDLCVIQVTVERSLTFLL